MNIGRLDKQIDLKSVTLGAADSNGYATESQSTIATVWASVREERGSELFKSGREVGTRYATFIIRYRSDVTQKTQIVFDSKQWDIESIRTGDITRPKEFLELFARAHD